MNFTKTKKLILDSPLLSESTECLNIAMEIKHEFEKCKSKYYSLLDQEIDQARELQRKKENLKNPAVFNDDLEHLLEEKRLVESRLEQLELETQSLQKKEADRKSKVLSAKSDSTDNIDKNVYKLQFYRGFGVYFDANEAYSISVHTKTAKKVTTRDQMWEIN